MTFALHSHQAFVAENVLLDGRLALSHQTQRWLAVADLHYGYELSQRVAGRLVPMWGMAQIEGRLDELIRDYAPRYLVILGDLVHDRSAGEEARQLLARLARRCEPIVIAGNHDRQLAGSIEFVDSWRADGFHFHHGHCIAEVPGAIQVIGHHHPASIISDGAGLRLKSPAFVQEPTCWIMPAFSPWAGGTTWKPATSSRIWLCTPERVFPLPQVETAPL